ncbi:NADH-quinone oxidoreductase subunit C [Aneurinibacillus sp. Ricciae_BoGa-3]|uniref:NADH-quinone oxidoreductase subunit C n=1 Tax=Aneurinibacillus sp. Ricciae_BoGa-3 TaxID=3022697 RepID=UPI002341BC70|nr:NADH-quinone oxidoreductase subunit C [Aneurinibacillus sp. Ricciae_BoGa-3]WCK54338.1 NADH-quinone oxidoreductase subunit C [Aneurinibacillus sp. Ricciae_BoGa-3]
MSDDTQKPTPEEKAAAAAKAKAAAAAKAAAEAKRKRMAEAGQAAPIEKEATQSVAEANGDADAKAKAAAAAKAKAAAAAAAKAKAAANAGTGAGDDAAAEPKKPSPNQPVLDKFVKLITDKLGTDAIQKSYINELSEHIPTLIVPRDQWHSVARLLHDHEDLAFDYLSMSLGVDYETYMESVCYLYSYKHNHNVCIKVTTDRDNPIVPSVTDIWAGADWFERETYDLLGITYEGHYNLNRILLPDDWVGHPLRKDYVQYDEEV